MFDCTIISFDENILFFYKTNFLDYEIEDKRIVIINNLFSWFRNFYIISVYQNSISKIIEIRFSIDVDSNFGIIMSFTFSNLNELKFKISELISYIKNLKLENYDTEILNYERRRRTFSKTQLKVLNYFLNVYNKEEFLKFNSFLHDVDFSKTDIQLSYSILGNTFKFIHSYDSSYNLFNRQLKINNSIFRWDMWNIYTRPDTEKEREYMKFKMVSYLNFKKNTLTKFNTAIEKKLLMI